MRILCLLATPLLLGAATLAAAAPATPTTTRAEARLGRALEGRVAGAPVDCIAARDVRSTEIVDRTAILYRTTGGRLYLNRPERGAASLDDGDILVTVLATPQLCSVDTVRLVDRASGFPTGFVGLGRFVPYAKPAAAR